MKKVFRNLADILFRISGLILLVYFVGFILWLIGAIFYDVHIVMEDYWLAIVAGLVFLFLLLVHRGVIKNRSN